MRISHLFVEAFKQYGIYIDRSLEAWRWRYLKHPGFMPEGMLQAYVGEELAGIVLVTKRPFQVGGEIHACFMIDDVATHPAHRGKGIAKALEEEAIALAKRYHAQVMSAYTSVGAVNDRLMQSLGFKPVTRMHHLDKVLNVKELVFRHTFDTLDLIRMGQPKKIKRPEGIQKISNIQKPDGELEAFEESKLDEIVTVLNKHGKKYAGFTPYSPGYFQWKVLLKPGFSPQNVILFRTEKSLNVCLVTFHRHRFTRSGRTLHLARIDDMAYSDEQTALALIQQACKFSKQAGAPSILTLVDFRDLEKYSLFSSCGFSSHSQGNVLLFCMCGSPADNQSLHYISGESAMGEP